MLTANIQEIKDRATEWSIDYRPWDENLDFKEYARYGYQVGYEQALNDVRNLLNENDSNLFRG
jgi:hypothetical protein